jgi:hypothetical protein
LPESEYHPEPSVKVDSDVSERLAFFEALFDQDVSVGDRYRATKWVEQAQNLTNRSVQAAHLKRFKG